MILVVRFSAPRLRRVVTPDIPAWPGRVNTVLVNQATMRDILAWGRNEPTPEERDAILRGEYPWREMRDYPRR